MGMKSNSGFFNGTNGGGKYKLDLNDLSNSPSNGKSYNLAKSKDVKTVTSQVVSSDRKLDMTGTANSVHTKTNSTGTVLTERYYGDGGKAYLDIDYSDHGNPKNASNCASSA